MNLVVHYHLHRALVVGSQGLVPGANATDGVFGGRSHWPWLFLTWWQSCDLNFHSKIFAWLWRCFLFPGVIGSSPSCRVWNCNQMKCACAARTDNFKSAPPFLLLKKLFSRVSNREKIFHCASVPACLSHCVLRVI